MKEGEISMNNNKCDLGLFSFFHLIYKNKSKLLVISSILLPEDVHYFLLNPLGPGRSSQDVTLPNLPSSVAWMTA